MPSELLAPLVNAHRQLATTGVLYMAAAGAWGLLMVWQKRPMDANYRGILIIGYVLGDLIGLLGAAIYVFYDGGTLLHDPLHILYGLITAVGLPMAAIWSQNRSDQQKPLIYGLAALFMMGIFIRGIMTATR
ncbi:MAG: hypothetical protein HY259_14900 [Chloroflexi bacterium]|nr:hypothetical protein [Chloroflexota bacterium]